MKKTCLREWRKYRNFTLEQVAAESGMTHQQLGKIERGIQPYNQKLLEFLADLYACDVPDLIMRPPGKRLGVQDVFDRIPQEQQEQALAVLTAFARTGTDG